MAINSKVSAHVGSLTLGGLDDLPIRQELGWIQGVASTLAHRLDEHSSEILDCLTTYETWSTARDELDRSIRTLAGISKEWHHIRNVNPEVRICSFLPVNQPLYALVLFGIVPSLMGQRVDVRPSSTTAAIVKRVWATTQVPEVADRLRIYDIEAQRFIYEHARHSDAVIVTGTHATASAVSKNGMTPRTVLIFNGTGINPTLVMPDADLPKAAEDIVKSATYNSGQDCAAPKCVLIHVDVSDDMIELLAQRIRSLKIGDTQNPTVDVGPVARRSSIDKVVDYLLRQKGQVIAGGVLDVPRRLVHPTLVVSQLDKNFLYPELYAPVVNVATFSDQESVADFAASDRYQRQAMYASVYGTLDKHLRNTHVLHNMTVLDYEDGNSEFGGFGSEASFVKIGGRRPIRGPVLISAALAMARRGLEEPNQPF